MGYFPNGTSSEAYFARYCSRCVFDREERPCPIWTIHLVLNYEQLPPPPGARRDPVASAKADQAELVLDLLIPRTPDRLGNEECSMFQARQSAEEKS